VQDVLGVFIVTIKVGGGGIDHVDEPQRSVATDGLITRLNRCPDNLFRAVNADDNG
jgi:hypothetical protein